MDKAAKASARLTQAAKIQGVEFNALIAGIDGAAKGTILANSDFGRFLSGLGLTNTALKEAAENGKTYELIMSKLADIPDIAAQGAKGYNASLASLNTTIEELRGELTKPLFEAITKGMRSFNELLVNNKELIKALPSAFASLAKDAAVFGAALLAVRNKAAVFAFIAAAVKSVTGAMTAMRAATLSTASATAALSAAKGALSKAFKAAPWGIVIAGLTAIASHFLFAKSAAEELADGWDGAVESLRKYGKAEREMLVEGLREKKAEQLRILTDLQSADVSVIDMMLGRQKKLSLEQEAQWEQAERKANEYEERIRAIQAFTDPKKAQIPLKTYNPEDAAGILKELQTERDKLLLSDLEKLNRERQGMIDQLAAKVAPNTNEFKRAMKLIGEIYTAELNKINDKADQDRQKLEEKLTSLGQAEAKAIEARYAAYQAEANALYASDENELKRITELIRAGQGAEILKFYKDEAEKAAQTTIRLLQEKQKIEELSLDNLAAAGAISEEEANRQKRLLQVKTSIAGVTAEIAALEKSGITGGDRVDLLNKELDALKEQQGIIEKQTPKTFADNLVGNLADDISGAVVSGVKSGSISGKDILSAALSSAASSVSAQISASIQAQAAAGNISAMAGGLASAGAAMGVGAAAALVIGEMTAQWEMTSQRDLLREIADNTRESAEAFKAYFTLVKRFGGVNTTFNAARASTQNADMSGESGYRLSDLGKILAGGLAALLPGITGGLSAALFGAVGGIFGSGSLEKLIGSVLGYNTISRKGFDGSLGAAKFLSAQSSGERYVKAAQEFALGWFDSYYDNIIKFNVEIGREVKKKKTLLGTAKKTTIYYAQLTEAQLHLAAFLKQFGTDKYGSLTLEGAKNFNEKMGALLAATEGIDALSAALRGESLTYNLDRSYLDLSSAAEYIAAVYNDALENAGITLTETIIGEAGESAQYLKDLSARDAAALFENLDLEAIIGRYGAAVNVDDLTAALESLKQAITANVEAIKAYANAQLERLSSEAEFTEWLSQTDSAVESAASSLRSFADGLRSFADQARDLITEGRSDDQEFLQRQYLTARIGLSNLYDGTGAIRGGLTQQYVQDVTGGYIEAARAFQGVLGDYDFTGKSALERELAQIAGAIDLSADILSVRIVGDNIDLATNQTISDLVAALTPSLSIDQIGFSGTSDTAKRALALASGAKTQDELNNLIEAIATLRFGGDASDADYLDNLARLAEYDESAARTAELLQQMLDELKEQKAINAESAKRLAAIERYEARAELAAEAAAGGLT
jgi:hypothetical protein